MERTKHILPLMVLVALALDATPASAGRIARQRIDWATARCTAAVTHTEAGLVPLTTPLDTPVLPIVGRLFDRTHSSTEDGPCPARSAVEGAAASSDADATQGGHWGFDLETTAPGSSSGYAAASVAFGATIESARAGDLYVDFDEVEQTFETRCDGCDYPGDAGYLTIISVHSRGGDASVACGTGAHNASGSAYRLPDDRCGLDADGTPARLPVSAGPVTVTIEIYGVADLRTGADPSSVGRAAAKVRARLAGLRVLRCGGSASC